MEKKKVFIYHLESFHFHVVPQIHSLRNTGIRSLNNYSGKEPRCKTSGHGLSDFLVCNMRMGLCVTPLWWGVGALRREVVKRSEVLVDMKH